MNAAAVTGLAVGIDSAAVPNRFQRIDSPRHHIAARLAVNRSNEADAAGIVLIRSFVGVCLFEFAGV
jgi:hypothetical protein